MTVETPVATRPAGGWVSRRRLWLCCALFFVGGLLLGAAAGILVLHRHLRFPPPLGRLTDSITSRVQKDFGLDAAAAGELNAGVRVLLTDMHRTALGTWRQMDEELLRQVEKLAPIFPEGEQRERWLREYRRYFPEPPPPPPPPPL